MGCGKHVGETSEPQIDAACSSRSLHNAHTATANQPAKAVPSAPSESPSLNHPESQKRAMYAAFASKDARFDGQVFVGVSSTGIYCRPICHAKMPKYENCTFFASAAEAEAAGYRPCLTCRPERSPGTAVSDAVPNLARRAAALLRESCTSGEGIERLAERLGYTDRHLRRVFEEEFHVTPVQYLQTCRLLLAKSLLMDTSLPVAQVAQAAGFKSVRRFNHVFKERYRLTPTDMRKRQRKATMETDCITLELGYRPPYNFSTILQFFRDRALLGVELVTEDAYLRTVRIGETTGWLRVTYNPGKHALALTISESLLPVLSTVIARVRAQFDIDCNPHAIYEGIRSMDEVAPNAAKLGTRLPGCFEPFETATRAVLGQQVSVKAANKFAARIVEEYGTPIDTGIEGLTHAFPTPAQVLTLSNIEEAFGTLGVIASRSRTIAELARLMESGELSLAPTANALEQIERLMAVKGIGAWSANYLAMRTMSYPDAFLETDAGIKHALPEYEPKQRLALAEQWRPWRSYANICLWNSLAE